MDTRFKTTAHVHTLRMCAEIAARRAECGNPEALWAQLGEVEAALTEAKDACAKWCREREEAANTAREKGQVA